MKWGKMSNRHVPNKLGYTRATIINTISYKDVSGSVSRKFIPVRIILCKSRI